MDENTVRRWNLLNKGIVNSVAGIGVVDSPALFEESPHLLPAGRVILYPLQGTYTSQYVVDPELEFSNGEFFHRIRYIRPGNEVDRLHTDGKIDLIRRIQKILRRRDRRDMFGTSLIGGEKPVD